VEEYLDEVEYAAQLAASAVWDHVLPFDVCNFPETTQVELIELGGMLAIQRPELTAIQQR
jgi:hypothetical protein